MRVVRGHFDEITVEAGRRVVTLGSFDGVHVGHRAILDELCRVARDSSLDGCATVTFGPHPRTVIEPDRRPGLLTDLEERIALLEAAGAELLVILEFDDRLASLDYRRFVEDFLVGRLGMDYFVLGHDVHFGKGRGGNAHSVADLADRLGFTMSQVASVRVDGEAVSSTRIRAMVRAGDLEVAVRSLGHPFPIGGVVEEGRRLGRTLGFPTANLAAPEGAKLLPALGVYVGWARVQGAVEWTPSVLNVGRAPTVGLDGPVRTEVHLLDTSGDFYGKPMQVAVAKQLRGETRFGGIDDLRAAIAADVAAARAWHAAPPREGRPERLGAFPEKCAS